MIAPVPSKTVLVGATTGLFSGLTGVGGGAMVVSLMVSVLGMSQHLAQGTTPAVILPVAFFGAITYVLQGISGQFEFDTGLALSIIPALAFPSMFGVLIGTNWMSALPAGQLRRSFGVFLFFVAFAMLTRDVLPIGTPPGEPIAIPFVFWILLGFVAGIMAGFLGIGGALVMVPFMTLGAGLPQHMSQGVILAVVAITTAVGAIAQYQRGNVAMPVVRVMWPVAVVTVVLASLVAGRLDPFWLEKLFGLAMAYFGYQFTFVKRPEAKASAAPTDPSAGVYSI